MGFPRRVSLTITNACNLRCAMCGQWSETGYLREPDRGREELTLEDWKRLVDEAASHGVSWVLIRGGEPFLFRGIMELLEYLRAKGLEVSLDTNGTLLERFAAELAQIDGIHMTVSVDGPEEIHDAVRGVKGAFGRIEKGLVALRASGSTIPVAICFTISRYSNRGLGDMPEVARRLGVGTLVIVPYCYVPEAVGRKYEEELRGLGCRAFSWRGFQHEDSGVDFEEFRRQLRRFRETLGSIETYPYMELSEDEYRAWFADATTQVGTPECRMIEELIDIQPNGEANFCVDFPDYTIGNVRDNTIEELWNGERAERFREVRRKGPLAVCYRCGAKYMAK